MPTLRFGCAGQQVNVETESVFVESVGGFLRPWSKRVEIVSKQLAVEYGFGSEDVQDTLRSLTNFVEAKSFALAAAAGNMVAYGSFLSEAFQYYEAGGEIVGQAQPCIVCALLPLHFGRTSGSRASPASGLPSADDTRASGEASGSRASPASGLRPSPGSGLPSADDTRASGQASGSRASPASGLPMASEKLCGSLGS